MTALILNQISYADPGHVGDALDRRGVAWTLEFRETLDWEALDVRTYELLVLLGSMCSPLDSNNPAVAAELRVIDQAQAAGIPIFGICYGGELLALANGGELFPLRTTCFGYHEVSPSDRAGSSQWQFFWNHLGFTAPLGSEVVAQGPESCWIFRQERAVAVQFHPDANDRILERWTQEGADEIRELGRSAGEVVSAAIEHAAEVAQFCDDSLEYLLG